MNVHRLVPFGGNGYSIETGLSFVRDFRHFLHFSSKMCTDAADGLCILYIEYGRGIKIICLYNKQNLSKYQFTK